MDDYYLVETKIESWKEFFSSFLKQDEILIYITKMKDEFDNQNFDKLIFLLGETQRVLEANFRSYFIYCPPLKRAKLNIVKNEIQIVENTVKELNKEEFGKELKMDVISRLKAELPSCMSVLKDWNSSGTAYTMMESLKKELLEKDYEMISYCLLQIIDSLEDEVKGMTGTPFGEYYINANKRSIEVFKECSESLKEFSKNNEIQNENSENDVTSPIIFLSHQGNDIPFGNVIEKFLMGLGLKKEQLIYSSHPKHKIPLGQNIFQYLRNNINNKVLMLILWSNDYLESPACLNEMGAAWVTDCDYENIFVPSFDFNNPKRNKCALDTNKVGLVLNGDASCKTDLITLKEKICSIFKLEIDEQDLVLLLDDIQKELVELNKK